MTGTELKKARVEAGLTQKQLSDKWGVSRLTINQWERRGNDLLPNPKMAKILINELLKK